MKEQVNYFEYFNSPEEFSKEIDLVIEQEKFIKSKIPDHPQYSEIRIKLDIKIKELRRTKKDYLISWREVKRNPVIKP